MKFWLLLLASSLPAQTVQRLYFTRAANAENIADISSALRLVLNVKDVAPGKDSIAVRATYPQAEAGRWLIADFEEPAGIKDRDLHEYRLRDGSGEFLRVFYPDRELTPQAMEERVSLLHALAITQKAISYNAPRAILMRGSKLR